MKADDEGAAPSPLFAWALLAVSACFLWFATEIPQSALSGKHDPGPRALPILLSCLLAAGGCFELIRAAWRRFGAKQHALSPQRSGSCNRQVLILAGGLVCYLAVISQLGFYATTSVFAFLASWWLGARWWSAMLASAAMMAVVFLLFGVVFEVHL